MDQLSNLFKNFSQQPKFGMDLQTPVAPQPQGAVSNPFETAGGSVGLGVPGRQAFDGSTNQLGTDGSAGAAVAAVQGINVASPALLPEGVGQKLQLFA